MRIVEQACAALLRLSQAPSAAGHILAMDIGRPTLHNLSSLQAGRAVAAILVILFHNSVAIFALQKYWGTKPFGRLFDFGDSGVLFFFVLSGFIILYAHYQDLDRPDRVRHYVWRRFRCIYPMYWIVLIPVVPIYFAFASFGNGFETQPLVIVSSFLLVHLESLHVISSVSWSLYHEVLFYSIFALVIWNIKIGSKALGVWLLCSVAGMATNYASWVTTFYFSHLHLLFGFGMAGAWMVRRGSVPLPMTAALLGASVFLLAGADEAYWNQIPEKWRTLVFGLGATLAVIGLAELEHAARLRIPAWLQLLGDASYSIYLVHFFILSLLAKLAWSSGIAPLFSQTTAYVLLALTTIAAGVLLHIAVERPLLGLLSRSTRHRASLEALPGDVNADREFVPREGNQRTWRICRCHMSTEK